MVSVQAQTQTMSRGGINIGQSFVSAGSDFAKRHCLNFLFCVGLQSFFYKTNNEIPTVLYQLLNYAN